MSDDKLASIQLGHYKQVFAQGRRIGALDERARIAEYMGTCGHSDFPSVLADYIKWADRAPLTDKG